MTPPSTTRAQDQFRRPFQPGAWLCRVCEPNTHGKGGDPAWRSHYAREHLATHYDTPAPAGFVPPVRAQVAA